MHFVWGHGLPPDYPQITPKNNHTAAPPRDRPATKEGSHRVRAGQAEVQDEREVALLARFLDLGEAAA